MTENICKQLLTREIKSRSTQSRNEINYNRYDNHNVRYGYVICKKHDCLTCFLKTYKGCKFCNKEKSALK